MAPHPCPNCGRLNHFEVRVCPTCSFTLGYCPDRDRFLFLGDNLTAWRDAQGTAHDVVVCANNNEYEICNWLVGRNDHIPFCKACRHNRTIPDLTQWGVPQRWGKIEAAKRRMFHTLIRLGLPLESRNESATGLAFDFLYDPAAEAQGQAEVLTGHDGGLITLNIIEADDVQRERIRHQMGEPYRTLIGHFRHEVGHHFWSRLVEDTAELQGFRDVFGDETIDYAAALETHYGGGGGARPDWGQDFVSFYATSHPWEDFAETFAHFLHIVDSLATVRGLELSMKAIPGHPEPGWVGFDPYDASTEQLVGQWVPFSFAENALSRSMGQADLYPFHLTPAIIAKLDYVNGLVARAAGRATPLAEAA